MAAARDAYIFTFPLHELYRVRAQRTSAAGADGTPVNQFRHARALIDHTFRLVTTPNNDTLYSSAFLQLAGGPLVLEVPEIRDRYYSLAFMDFYSNNFAYVGTRATGVQAGKFLIAGPSWQGSLEPGMQLIRSPTNAVWLLGRILVADPNDLPRVHRLQDALRLSPAPGAPPSPAPSGPPVKPDDPWNYFTVVNHALTENPPGRQDASLLASMASINVGPGMRFDASRLSDSERASIETGIAEARRLIAEAPISGKVVNGWAYPAPGMGNYGGDYLLRAAVALKLLAALEPQEALYLGYVGERLEGRQNYRLHFDSGTLPPVNGFWSLTLYNDHHFFAPNPLKRYSLGTKNKTLKFSHDGSLTIYLQADSPGPDKESNWLPTPKDSDFSLYVRTYWPKVEVTDGTWTPPPVKRAE